jgi:hypothetical protein
MISALDIFIEEGKQIADTPQAIELFKRTLPLNLVSLRNKMCAADFARLDISRIINLAEDFATIYFGILEYKLEEYKKLGGHDTWVNRTVSANAKRFLEIDSTCQDCLEKYVIYFYHRLARNDTPTEELQFFDASKNEHYAADFSDMHGLGHEIAEDIIAKLIKFSVGISKRYFDLHVPVFSSPPVTELARTSRTGVMPSIF